MKLQLTQFSLKILLRLKIKTKANSKKAHNNNRSKHLKIKNKILLLKCRTMTANSQKLLKTSKIRQLIKMKKRTQKQMKIYSPRTPTQKKTIKKKKTHKSLRMKTTGTMSRIMAVRIFTTKNR